MNDERRRAITSTPRLSPDDIAGRTFSSSFRGIAEAEVKAFLRRAADELAESLARAADLERALAQAEVAASEPRRFTDEELLDQLGEETARLLHAARDAAKDIREKAESNAQRMVTEAQESSQAMREEAETVLAVRTREAEATAEAIIEAAERDAHEVRAAGDRAAEALRLEADSEAATMRADASRVAELQVEDARNRSREMVEHARELREKVLADLSHRRTLLTEQIAELRTGREKLLEAYRVVKRSYLDATEALAHVEGRAAVERPDPVDPEVIAAAMRGEVGSLADDTAAELADEVDRGDLEESDSDAPEPADLGADATEAALPDPDDLFARIRAQRAADDAPTTGTPGATGATDSTASTVSTVSAEPAAEVDPANAVEPRDVDDRVDGEGAPASELTTPSGRAAAAVADAVDGALRAAKRIAQDEQNAVLDALRRHKGHPDSGAVLPAPREQASAWIVALSDAVATVYSQGSASLGGSGSGTLAVELAAELVTGVLDPVRARFAQAIDESEDANEAIERLNARAREFRTQQLESTLGDLLAGVYARGVYDAAPSTAMLQWVIAESGCSADCADNALEPAAKGSEFPTGHRHPPAHVGCRCSLTTTVVEVHG